MRIVFCLILICVDLSNGQTLQFEDILIIVPKLSQKFNSATEGIFQSTKIITDFVKKVNNGTEMKEQKKMCAEFIEENADLTRIDELTAKCQAVIDHLTKSRIRSKFIFDAITNSTVIKSKERFQKLEDAFQQCDKVDMHQFNRSLDFWFKLSEEFNFVSSSELKKLKPIVTGVLDEFKEAYPELFLELSEYHVPYDETNFTEEQLNGLFGQIMHNVAFMLKPKYEVDLNKLVQETIAEDRRKQALNNLRG